MEAIIYARVSTAHQDYTRQLDDLAAYAEKQGWTVRETITEKISGTKKAKNRAGASRLIQAAGAGVVVCVSEISRLGRNAKDVQDTIHALMQKGARVYVQQFGMCSHNADGRKNPLFQLIADVVANLAQLENESRKGRIMSGLAKARRDGKQLGRPQGTTKDITETKNYKMICRNLREGLSIRKTAKICDVSPATVQKVKKHITPQQQAGA